MLARLFVMLASPTVGLFLAVLGLGAAAAIAMLFN